MLVREYKHKCITISIHSYLFSSSTGEQELYDDDAMLHASLSVSIDRVYVALS